MWTVLGVAVVTLWWIPVLCVPWVIRSLPEPSVPVLPPEGSAEDTALTKALREEGPKVPYREVGSGSRVLIASIVLGVLLAVPLRAVGEPRLEIAALAFVPALVLLWIVDWRTRLLPRVVVLPLTGVVVALALIDWIVRRDTDALIRELCGGALSWLIFGTLWFIRRAGMGLGDVRLALPLGVLTAAVSWNAWLIGLYASFIGFALFGLGLMLVKRDRSVLKRAHPFGPFMIIGAYGGMALAPHLLLFG